MAIQISGTTVVNDSRQLQNIASLDSTTTSTIQAAGPTGSFAQGAWVNWNAQSSTSIRDDGNVSSITDYGTGHWGINLSSALTDANFVFSGWYGGVYGSGDISVRCLVEVNNTVRTSSFIRFTTRAANAGSTGLEDSKYNTAQLLR